MHYLLRALRAANMLAKETSTTSAMLLQRPRFNSNGTHNYEAAIDALNTLQSNAQYLRNRKAAEAAATNTHTALRRNCIETMSAFLNRCNIDAEQLKSVIHIAGTKGKGSTSAFCESILRHHGYTTGFYSSPHLTCVTERIRLNGRPVDTETFAQAFWQIYQDLVKTKAKAKDQPDMPIYFQMLTLMAFKIFTEAEVDVAIVEVGIGGEYDSTNVIRNTEIVGITSLGLDHTSILGTTIEEIAWHKAGVLKKGCRAFSAPQTQSALQVLRQRSSQAGCNLEVVDVQEITQDTRSTMPEEVYRVNASLAVRLAKDWLQHRGKQLSSEITKRALDACSWPGRFQVWRMAPSTNFYLDGAHTLESLKYCTRWYLDTLANNSHEKKALIFNSTGDRDVAEHLRILRTCEFDKVYFVPNVLKTTHALDNINHNFPEGEQLIKCATNKNIWCATFPEATDRARVLPSVNAAIEEIIKSSDKYDVLITGSLHLVGSALQALEIIHANIDKKSINALHNL